MFLSCVGSRGYKAYPYVPENWPEAVTHMLSATMLTYSVSMVADNMCRPASFQFSRT